MGLPLARSRASLRFSLTRQNTDADIDTALELVPPPSPVSASFRPSTKSTSPKSAAP